MMLKDSSVKQSEGQAVEATLKVGRNALHGFLRAGAGHDEIGMFPQHGAGARRRPGEGRPRHFQIAGEATISNFQYRPA